MSHSLRLLPGDVPGAARAASTRTARMLPWFSRVPPGSPYVAHKIEVAYPLLHLAAGDVVLISPRDRLPRNYGLQLIARGRTDATMPALEIAETVSRRVPGSRREFWLALASGGGASLVLHGPCNAWGIAAISRGHIVGVIIPPEDAELLLAVALQLELSGRHS